MQHPLDFAMAAFQLALLAGSVIAWAALFERLAARRTLVEYEPRAQVPWSGFDLAVLAVVWLVFETTAQLAIASDGDARPKMQSASMVATVGISRLVWLVFAIAYLGRRAGAYADDMGFDTRKLKSDLRLAGFTFLAAVLPVYGLQLLLTHVFGFKSEHPLAKLAQEQGSLGVLVLSTVVAVGLAPVVEEFLLRVVLQGWLEKKQLEWRERRGHDSNAPAGFGPIVVSASIFAVLHAWPDSLALFTLSLFLGYVYQRTHRIIAPLAVHVCVNSLAMLELWRAFLTGPS